MKFLDLDSQYRESERIVLKEVETAKELLNDYLEHSLSDIELKREINSGIEELDYLLTLINKEGITSPSVFAYTGINISYGTEDADAMVESAKRIAKGIFKFILKILDRILTFVSSFFNKGISLTEKLYLAAIIRYRDILGKKIDEKNGNKNQPLDLKEFKFKSIVKYKDFFILTALKNNNTIDPTMTMEYVRSTLTLFTDNVITFDNTVDSLNNIVKGMKNDTVNDNTLVGYLVEKNKSIIHALSPLKTMFNRNDLLKKIIEEGMKNRKDGFEVFVIPFPLKGIENGSVKYLKVSIVKPETLSKMKADEIKGLDDLYITKEEALELSKLGINIDKVENIKIKSMSYNEIDNVVTAFQEASEKIKKKLNGDKIVKKIEKLRKATIAVESGNFDSKTSGIKVQYYNAVLKTAVALLESSKEIYKSGYCESLKNYIMAHEY